MWERVRVRMKVRMEVRCLDGVLGLDGLNSVAGVDRAHKRVLRLDLLHICRPNGARLAKRERT